MKELFKLNKYFYRYRTRLLLGALFVVVSNYFRTLEPQIVRHALDLVVDNIGMYKLMDGSFSQKKLFKTLGGILLLFGSVVIILSILKGIFMYFMRQTIIVMSRLIEFDLRNDIFAHYEKLSLAFFKKNNTGDLMARITEDVSKVRMYLGPAIMYGINLVSLFVLVIYSMVKVSPELTKYCLLPLPFLSLSIYIVSSIINKKSTAIQQQLSSLNNAAQEVYSGIRVIKSYVQEGPMARFFRSESDLYKDKTMELARVEALFHPLMILLIGLSNILTIYIGGLLVIKGAITPGNVAEFVIYINMLTWPVTAIGWVASIIQRAAASQKRINEFMDTEPDILNRSSDDSISPLRGAIRFEDVNFVYPDTGINALKGISFKLKPGEKMAIIGKTGSGKTTIADLILRMYDLDKGKILIDDLGIEEHNLSKLRKRIGYVPQDVFLFSDTVANNIAFGKENSDIEEVKKYSKYASVYNEILGLSDGFDTIVGERGVTLSGGQKQRISIARALIKEPDILILDDCLSAVDTETEKHILSYFNEYLKSKTAIIITHRIYSLLNFDKIIVLEDGKIVEEGNHEDLMKIKGRYFDLYEKQKIEQVEL